MREIWDGESRARALSELASHLGPKLLPEAVAAAQAIGDEWRGRGPSGLAPHLGPDLLSEAMSAAWAIGDEWARALALSGLAPRLISQPKSSLVHLWSDTLHNSSVGERSGLLSDLKAMSPIVLALGGAEGAEELAPRDHRSRTLVAMRRGYLERYVILPPIQDSLVVPRCTRNAEWGKEAKPRSEPSKPVSLPRVATVVDGGAWGAVRGGAPGPWGQAE